VQDEEPAKAVKDEQRATGPLKNEWKGHLDTPGEYILKPLTFQFKHSVPTSEIASVSSGQSSWLQNGDVVCFLWGTNWIYICYIGESRPPLWSSGQSSWLQLQRSGFHSRRCQIFWEAVGLERGPLNLVSTTEELLERKVSGSGLENREYDLGIRHADHAAPSIRERFALTSLTSDGRSVGLVR
jgi:hypothetical protein